MLRVAQRIPVPDTAATTVAIDEEGRFWLGGRGRLWVQDSATRVKEFTLPGAAVPRVLGWGGSTGYLRVDGALARVGLDADSAVAWRGGMGTDPLVLDVRKRAIFQGARSGAVIAHDPETLEPIWAWASLDMVTTAMALSPEGDRLYQALGGEGEPAILIRDLQTGRVLAREAFAAPLVQLVAAPGGLLYGLAEDDGRVAAVALRLRRRELEVLWRRALEVGEARDLQLAVQGGRVAVWGAAARSPLRLLSAVDGAPIGRSREPVRDAGFDGVGALWVLHPGELRRLE